jgi:lysophospholipase L1-like esterase
MGTAGRRAVVRLTVMACLLGGVLALPAASSNAGSRIDDGRVRALFFGDSLMTGIGARPVRPMMARIAAHALGWDVTVDAVPGTGYTTGGHRSRPYLQRLREPGVLSTAYDVVLLEGGTNDKAADPGTMHALTTETVEYVRSRLPTAQIVLMGAYNPLGARYDARRVTIDATIRQVAVEQDLPYFSPISGHWLRGQGRSFLCSDRLHPSTYGYGVMGAKLVAALRASHIGAG